MKLTIGYFYPHLLNLYGDTGNVEVMKQRALKRGIEVEIIYISPNTKLDLDLMKKVNFVFMGGGPDSSQKEMYDDLVHNKGPYLREYIEDYGMGLFVCGSYQLLGKYYKSADGSVLEGLGVINIHTEHFGNNSSRCIGNVVCEIVPELRHDPVFNHLNNIGSNLVGFENHGGRTYLGKSVLPLAKVIKGDGNNSVDNTEGALYKNVIGTYLHGPILARNPHLSDYLVAKSLKIDTLKELDDSLVISAHTASTKLR